MSRRHFHEISVREQGIPTRRYRLTCGSCGCGDSLGRQSFGPAMADELVPKKFSEKGWHVGKRNDGADDRCPACLNREHEAQRRRARPDLTASSQEPPVPSEKSPPVVELTMKAAPTPNADAAVKADTPREMTREHRRLIFLKLEEVYIDERSGYSAGWTDARLASDLGVPRAWVSTIRDENFGPGTSEEIAALTADARAVLAEAAEFRAAMEALTARGTEILKRADAIDRASKRIEAALR